MGEASDRKEVAFIHPIYRAWFVASPFALVATSGPGGLDTSPRSDPALLARVVNEHTLLLPERRGNHRVDGLAALTENAAGGGTHDRELPQRQRSSLH